MQETYVNSTTAEQALTVLVVEDDEGLNLLIRKTLAKQGYKTYQALTGAEALQFLAKDSNVIVLLDYILPDMNGKQVIRAIKEENIAVPLIIMTGHGDEAIAIDMMKMGVRDYIIKRSGYIENLPNIIHRIKKEVETEKELARAEEALRESEKRFRLFFNHAPEYCYMISLEGTILDVNRVALERLGYQKEELAGKPIQNIYAPESIPRIKELFRQWKETGDIQDKEMEIITKSGENRTVLLSASVVRDSSGNALHSISIQKDITDRKRAEEELRRHNLILSTQQEASIDGILVVDENGNITSYNRRFVDMWGIPADVVESKLDARALQSVMGKLESPEEFMSKVKHLYKAGHETSRDEIGLKDGRTFDRYSAPMRGPDGKNYGRVWYFRDITYRKRAEEEKLKYQSQLQQSHKMELIGQLTGGIAHDFNNILGGIVGYADLLMLRFENEPDLVKYAEKIKSAGLKASNHTRSLLTFARRAPLENEAVDIHNSITHIIDILQNTIDKRVKIQFNLIAHKHDIKGDAGLIENMFLNIGINARDAMPHGGALTIETKTVPLDERSFESEPFKALCGEYVHISITDIGVGMDKNILQHLFEPFFTTKEVGKGTGLGLASVFGTVKQHGGYITVKSAEGKGTTFDVYLPVLEKSEDLQSQKENKEIIKGSRNILLIDDEASIREAVSDLLRSIGYTVSCCNNGTEAIEYYSTRHTEIDAVIIDMIMPEMNGPDCFRRLKEINPAIVAIVASGYWEKEEFEQVVKMGVKTLLKKPFSINQLSCALADVLKK